MRRGLLLGLVFLSAILTGGCGSGHVPVTGVVNFNGTPVSGAFVTLISDDGKHSFSGVTSDTGNFELISQQAVGALPGTYKVTVVKTPPGASSEATMPGAPEYLKDMQSNLKKGGPPGMMPGGGPPSGMKMPSGPGGKMSAPPGMMPNTGGGTAMVKSELPQIYAQGITTPLKVTIPNNGPIVLELTGEAPKPAAKK
jgi:Protein of unknown function (DUF1416)